MTPLRQRMTDNMTVRGLAENTKKSYLNSVAGLARHYRRSPDRISTPEVQDYLIHLHEQKGLAWQSCNCVRHGVRFLLLFRTFLDGGFPGLFRAVDTQISHINLALPDRVSTAA